MRRRRQKNTLLPKMLGLAVLVNAILLPLLAQLGVFKVMRGQRLTPVELVQAPPPPPKPKTQSRKPKPRVAQRRRPGRRAAPRASTRMARADTTHLHLATALPGKGGTGGDNGPTAPAFAPPGPPAKGPTGPVTKPPVTLPPVTPTPAPAPTPPQPAPAPTPPPVTPPPLHVPVLVSASVLHQVDPQVPDDFSDENLPVTFRALFIVHTDGTATVETQSSTGDKTLDQLALDAARRWTFRPATEDGKPIDGGKLRLRVEFVPKDEG